MELEILVQPLTALAKDYVMWARDKRPSYVYLSLFQGKNNYCSACALSQEGLNDPLPNKHNLVQVG